MERILRHFERKLKSGMSLGNLKVLLLTFVTWKQMYHAKKAVVFRVRSETFLFPTMQAEM